MFDEVLTRMKTFRDCDGVHEIAVAEGASDMRVQLSKQHFVRHDDVSPAKKYIPSSYCAAKKKPGAELTKFGAIFPFFLLSFFLSFSRRSVGCWPGKRGTGLDD